MKQMKEEKGLVDAIESEIALSFFNDLRDDDAAVTTQNKSTQLFQTSAINADHDDMDLFSEDNLNDEDKVQIIRNEMNYLKSKQSNQQDIDDDEEDQDASSFHSGFNVNPPTSLVPIIDNDMNNSDNNGNDVDDEIIFDEQNNDNNDNDKKDNEDNRNNESYTTTTSNYGGDSQEIKHDKNDNDEETKNDIIGKTNSLTIDTNHEDVTIEYRTIVEESKQRKEDVTTSNTKHIKKKLKKCIFSTFSAYFRSLSVFDFITDILLLYKASTKGDNKNKETLFVCILLFISIVVPYILSYSSGVRLFLFRKTFSHLEGFLHVLIVFYLSPLGVLYFVLLDFLDVILTIYRWILLIVFRWSELRIKKLEETLGIFCLI